MSKYTIPAKLTKYRGRIYRSRLEARVAAFFDIRGLPYEYEPMDFKGWSPDFLVTTTQGIRSLVEVKPQSDFFDMSKYQCFDYKEYGLILICPDFYVILTGVGIGHMDLTTNQEWIQAGNEVMFLKPL